MCIRDRWRGSNVGLPGRAGGADCNACALWLQGVASAVPSWGCAARRSLSQRNNFITDTATHFVVTRIVSVRRNRLDALSSLARVRPLILPAPICQCRNNSRESQTSCLMIRARARQDLPQCAEEPPCDPNFVVSRDGMNCVRPGSANAPAPDEPPPPPPPGPPPPPCLLYTSPSPRDRTRSRMPSSA